MRITHLPKTIRSGGDFSNKIMGREGKERKGQVSGSVHTKSSVF